MQEDTPEPSIFSLQGRFNRFSFLGWNCLLLIINLIIGLIVIIFMPNTINALIENINSWAVQGFIIAINIFYFVFIFLFSIKRLHDFNVTGWVSLLNLVPLINFLFFIFLIFKPGSTFQNNYGPPRSTKTWESILATIFILVFSIAFFSVITSLLSLLRF